ncbi:MAG: hypothetical protein ACW99Q_16510 [Candidatus Kariarchaeaceae archaeon]|jgi:hypothetical protein
MEEAQMLRAKSLLKKHDYVIQAFATDYGCIIHFPERKEHQKHSRFKVEYVLDRKHEYVTLRTRVENAISTNSISRGRIIIKGPLYAHKSIVVFHLLKMCMKLRYAYHLVEFNINGCEVDEEKFVQTLTYHESPIEEIEKEDLLLSLAMAAFRDNFNPPYTDMAAEQDVLEGYQAIAQLVNPVKGKVDE